MLQVEIKAWRNEQLKELLLILPNEGTWREIIAQAETVLQEAKGLTGGRKAQVTLYLATRCLAHSDLEAFVERLKSEYGMITVGVVGTDTITQEGATRLGLNTYFMLPGASQDGPLEQTADSNALYIANTVRSGQRIYHKGHIIIAADVNAGAEVISEGDILIFGTLRGLAHAGCRGDESASIQVGNMRPQQIRIASQIARAPEDSPLGSGGRHPEIARIVKGEIQVFPA